MRTNFQPRPRRGGNCSSLLTYHTYGGEIREPLAATDAEDLNTFKQLTTQGLLQSGYDKVRSGIGGAFLNWAYKHRGIVAYLTEVWNLQKAAGVKVGATSGTGNDASTAAIGGMNTESESLLVLSKDTRMPGCAAFMISCVLCE